MLAAVAAGTILALTFAWAWGPPPPRRPYALAAWLYAAAFVAASIAWRM